MLLTNLKVLLAERNLTISKVSSETSISRTTLTALANNASLGIQFDTLDKLCQYLNVSPTEFFQFYNGDLSVSYDDIDNDNFFADIIFCHKHLSLHCDFTYSLQTVKLVFDLDTLEDIDKSQYIASMEIYICTAIENGKDALTIRELPTQIKQLLQDKFAFHVFEIVQNQLQDTEHELVNSDKTKYNFTWIR